jgi:hypothetical protein
MYSRLCAIPLKWIFWQTVHEKLSILGIEMADFCDKNNHERTTSTP